jgi:hypothetical protein
MPPHERMLIKGIFSQPPEQHTKMKTHSKVKWKDAKMNHAPVTHACNRSYSRGWEQKNHSSRPAQVKFCEISSQPIDRHGGELLFWRMLVSSQPWQKVHKTPYQLIAGRGGLSVIPPTAGSINRRTVVQASPGEKWDLISEITRTKRAVGIAQAVAHLSTKCKALSSNASTTKKKKKNLLKSELIAQIANCITESGNKKVFLFLMIYGFQNRYEKY